MDPDTANYPFLASMRKPTLEIRSPDKGSMPINHYQAEHQKKTWEPHIVPLLLPTLASSVERRRDTLGI